MKRIPLLSSVVLLACWSVGSAATIGWCNLQWPPVITVTQGASTEFIYGQVWSDGVTNGPGQGPGILGQVGYGPQADDPAAPSWFWTAMSYNVDVGNNDEYMAALTPANVGTFAYTTRFSGDGGATWVVTDRNGPGYSVDQAGVLTVTPIPEPTAALLFASLPMLALRRRRV